MRYFVGNNEIKIHFFDMDHTLINNDCDVSWKEFLTEEKIAPSNAMEIADNFLMITIAESWILMNLSSFS